MKLIFCLAILILTATTSLAFPLRIALVLEHDQPSAWHSLLKKGLAAAADQDTKTEIIVAPPETNQQDIFRQAASNNDLVVVASDNLHEILRDNAANFRRVKFGSIDAGIRAPNIMSVTFADEQASFLAGAAAAILAKKPIIGWLSGEDTPAMRSLFNGYSEGALLARPGARIIQAVIGSFSNPEEARRKAAWLIDSGAEVLAIAAGAGSKAATELAISRQIPVIELDAASGVPALGVITKKADKAIEDIINAAKSDNFLGKEIITYNLENNGVRFENRSTDSEIARRVSELHNEIVKGGIRIHSLRQRTLCDCLD